MAATRGGDDPRPRGQAELLGALGAHDEHGGRAVVERARVAGGDGAVGPEGRLEVAQDLHRRARPRAVVAADLGAVLQRDGDDLAIEVAALDGVHRAVLRDHGPLVLLLAGHVAALGDVLGGQPHRDVDVEERAVRAVELVVLELVGHARAQAGARDGLDAGGDVLVALAHRDGVEGHAQRLQRRRAEAVDRAAGDVMVDAGQQRRVAPDVVGLLGEARRGAHHHVVGLGEVDAGVALDERLERHGGELVGAEVLERPLERAPDRRAHGIDDDGF